MRLSSGYDVFSKACTRELLTCCIREQVISRLTTTNGRIMMRTCMAQWIPRRTDEITRRVSNGRAADAMARRMAVLKGRILNRRSGAQDTRAASDHDSVLFSLSSDEPFSNRSKVVSDTHHKERSPDTLNTSNNDNNQRCTSH